MWKLTTWLSEINRNIIQTFLYICLHVSDLVDSLDGILTTLLDDNIQVWAMKSQSEHKQVHTLLDKVDVASDQPVPKPLRFISSLKSPTLYIFTSGTTGESVGLFLTESHWEQIMDIESLRSVK